MAEWMVKVRTVDGEFYVLDFDDNVTGPSLIRRLKLKYLAIKVRFLHDIQHEHWDISYGVKVEAEDLSWVKYAEANLPPYDPDVAVY